MNDTAQPTFVTLHEFATLAGRYRWLEQRLFEVLGGWAAVEADPGVRIVVHTHSFHAAWHADLWQGLIPTLHDRAVDRVTAPANDEVSALVTALAAPQDPGQTVERLVGAYQVVLPALLAAYAAHRAAASPVSDGPAIRVLDIIDFDLRRDIAAGEALLGAALADGDLRDRADRHRRELVGCLDRAGGLLGGDAVVGEGGPRHP